MWTGLLLTFLVIIIVYDSWCFAKGSTTLSQKVRDWTAAYPLFSFLIGLTVGLLAGHWWWPMGCLPFIGVC